ncbi:hypothetical protein PG988_013658 [Apiospora saccharicola]
MKPSRPLIRQDQLLRTLQSPTSRCLRPSISPQCPRFQQQARTFLRRSPTSHRAVENLNLDRMRHNSYDYHVRRRNFMMAGAVSGALAFIYTAYLLQQEITKPKKFDSGLPAGSADPFSTEAGSKRKTIVHDADGREIVPTGHSSITSFPRTLELDTTTTDDRQQQHPTKVNMGGVEYTLVGLGMRTVSFLSIQVYLVGYYVATSDVAALQQRLMREIHPTATTLVPSEKDELRRRLLDPVEGDKIWQGLLREVKPRSLFRIVPVRDTDFHHLRDGFVRAITARSNEGGPEYKEDSFGEAMRSFRDIFNRGKVPKAGELIMARDERGRLTVVFDDSKSKNAEGCGSRSGPPLAVWMMSASAGRSG